MPLRGAREPAATRRRAPPGSRWRPCHSRHPACHRSCHQCGRTRRYWTDSVGLHGPRVGRIGTGRYWTDGCQGAHNPKVECLRPARVAACAPTRGGSHLACRAMTAALDEVRTRSLERRRSSCQGVTPAAAAPRTRHPPGPALGPMFELGLFECSRILLIGRLRSVPSPCNVEKRCKTTTTNDKRLRWSEQLSSL